jgi:hypothetical protein
MHTPVTRGILAQTDQKTTTWRSTAHTGNIRSSHGGFIRIVSASNPAFLPDCVKKVKNP